LDDNKLYITTIDDTKPVNAAINTTINKVSIFKIFDDIIFISLLMN